MFQPRGRNAAILYACSTEDQTGPEAGLAGCRVALGAERWAGTKESRSGRSCTLRRNWLGTEDSVAAAAGPAGSLPARAPRSDWLARGVPGTRLWM